MSIPEGQWRWARPLDGNGNENVGYWCLTDGLPAERPTALCRQRVTISPVHQSELGEFIPTSRHTECLNQAAKVLGLEKN